MNWGLHVSNLPGCCRRRRRRRRFACLCSHYMAFHFLVNMSIHVRNGHFLVLRSFFAVEPHFFRPSSVDPLARTYFPLRFAIRRCFVFGGWGQCTRIIRIHTHSLTCTHTCARTFQPAAIDLWRDYFNLYATCWGINRPFWRESYFRIGWGFFFIVLICGGWIKQKHGEIREGRWSLTRAHSRGWWWWWW